MKAIQKWKRWASKLKKEAYALYLAYKDPRTPWYAKVCAACVVGYAFSPIDLIPDPIPVLGYLDDLILIPIGIALALKMVPRNVLVECRKEAQKATNLGRLPNWVAAGFIIGIWLLLLALAAALTWRAIGRLAR